MSCRTNPSPIRFCTGDHGLAEPNRNHRLAPHNSARQTGTKASARRSLDQAAPGQAQDTHQTKRRQGNRRTPSEASTRQGKLPPQLRQADRCQGKRRALPRQPTGANSRHNSAKQTGAKASARCSLDQAVPGQSQDTLQTKRRQGKRRALPRQPTVANPRHNSAKQTGAKASARRSLDQAAPRQAQDTHQDKQRQTKQRQVYKPKSPASMETGDFSLQRSGTISSGPLKKLRVSCVHERDGKQVPCVRSLCSYARESRAC